MSKIIEILIGNKSEFPLEHRLFNITALIGIIFCVLTSLINIIIGFSLFVIILPLLMGVAVSIFYYKSIKKQQFLFSAYGTLLLLSLGLYPLIWIYNGGSYGSVPYFTIFHSGMMAVLLSKLKHKFFVVIHFIVVGILFIVEYKFPNIIVGYDSELSRLLDVGLTMFLISIFTFVLVSNIIKQYNQSIKELEKLHKELLEVNDKLHVTSITDELTGIYNRRFVMDKLKEEIVSQPVNQSMSVIMFDIDYFKSVNDKYGHIIGDEVIIKISHTLRDNLRKTDTLGRIGGEEFLILLPDTNLVESKQIAEKLRVIVSNLKWENKEMFITISGGVYCKNQLESLIDILQKVDICLYKAKEKGRNIIKCYGDSDK